MPTRITKDKAKKLTTDINELVVGDNRTIQQFKDNVRLKKVPSCAGNLVEPRSSFAPLYPYNHVTETESGHVEEFDDTPEAERIFQMHRSGTYYEINPDGSKVTKIFGDDFEVILANNTIVVGGTRNVVIVGDCSLYVQGDCQEQVDGDYKQIVKGNYELKVDGDITVIGANTQIQNSNETRILSGGLNKIVGSDTLINKQTYTDLDLDGSIVDTPHGGGTIRDGVGTIVGTVSIDAKTIAGEITDTTIDPTPETILGQKNIGKTQNRVYGKKFK